LDLFKQLDDTLGPAIEPRLLVAESDGANCANRGQLTELRQGAASLASDLLDRCDLRGRTDAADGQPTEIPPGRTP